MEEKKKVVIKREEVAAFTEDACKKAGLGEDFFHSLWKNFLENDDIYKEYVYYLIKQEFPCEAKAEGYTIVDILIWQIDHFKARLDTDTSQTKQNPVSMVLLAFDTFMKLRKEPEKYLRHLAEDTGTDYIEKFGKRV
jgi:hypothetical protein